MFQPTSFFSPQFVNMSYPSKGWKKEAPRRHERTVMLARCGRKCFLGPGTSFPICKRGTCSISQKGVHAAYSRARQETYQGGK